MYMILLPVGLRIALGAVAGWLFGGEWALNLDLTNNNTNNARSF